MISDPLEAFRTALHNIAPVPATELEHLAQHATRREYDAGTPLLDVGEIPERCWYLADGFLRFYYLTENGREFNKAFSRPGEIVVALAGVVTGTPSEYRIEAVTHAVTVAFPSRLIPELYERHPCWDRIGRVLIEQMALRKEAREHELLLDPAIVRYRRFAERYPELVGVVPQRQVASYIGVTEQALSRVLREERDRC